MRAPLMAEGFDAMIVYDRLPGGGSTGACSVLSLAAYCACTLSVALLAAAFSCRFASWALSASIWAWWSTGAAVGWSWAGVETGALCVVAVSLSSCRPCTSVLRMRIDWPSERAAAGSLRDPNSTMITIATIRIFHGLSNRSANIICVLKVTGDESHGRGLALPSSLHGSAETTRGQPSNGR